jgi:2-iminobutanoate/2-iminopropanoate deaminase
MNPTRISFDLNGHDHGGAPVPAAARIGPFVATSGIRGVDCATGIMPAGVSDQVENMFLNLRGVIGKVGGAEDIMEHRQ